MTRVLPEILTRHAAGVSALALALTVATAPLAAQEADPPAEQTTALSESEEALSEAEQRALVALDGEYGSAVERRWRATLEERGLAEGENERNVFLASGVATVAIEKGAPGWIEARRIAHAIAEARAKANLAAMTGRKARQQGSADFISRSSFAQGELSSEPRAALDQLARLRAKAADLTEEQLDAALAEIDPDYDPGAYSEESAPDLTVVLETRYENAAFQAAAETVAGATTYKVIEGPAEDGLNHEVLVGIVWSPRLQRLAGAIVDARAPMPVAASGTPIAEMLPGTVGDAVTAFGTRVFIDEVGDRALLSFAQVEPAAVGAANQAQARRAALSAAEDIAIGQIASFMGEKIAFESETSTRQISQVYAELVQRGVEIETEQVRRIRETTGQVEITGATPVWREIVTHPETDQDIAVVAVAWTPSAQAEALRMGETLRNAGAEDGSATDLDPAGMEGEGMVFESEDPDSDAF